MLVIIGKIYRLVIIFLKKIHRETNGDLRIHILKLDKEIYQLKKDMAFQKETNEMDIMQKDNEIGRLIKKITEK